MDNKQITNHQLFTLTASISLGGSILFSASTVAGVAKQDSWLSVLIAVSYGIPIMLMYYYLGSKFPGMTLIGITKKIFGKWLGIPVVAVYIFLFITLATQMPWYNNYIGRLLHDTPIDYINIFFVAAIVIAVLYGVETFARASEFLILTFTVFFIIYIVLLVKEINPVYLTPVMENGILPALKGSVLISPLITLPSINILMLFPRHFSNMPQAKKAIIKGYLWSGGVTFVSVLMTVLVLGYALVARSSFPALLLASQISVGSFITRMEYIISIIWFFTHFMIGLAFFYSAVTSLSEMIGLKDHKKIAMPLGLIVLVYSGTVLPSTIHQGDWVITAYTPFIITFGFLIPLLLMIVYIIRKKLLHNLI